MTFPRCCSYLPAHCSWQERKITGANIGKTDLYLLLFLNTRLLDFILNASCTSGTPFLIGKIGWSAGKKEKEGSPTHPPPLTFPALLWEEKPVMSVEAPEKKKNSKIHAAKGLDGWHFYSGFHVLISVITAFGRICQNSMLAI